MANAARNLNEREQFWRPPVEHRESHQGPATSAEALCEYCGAQTVAGSGFCHECGGELEGHSRRVKISWVRFVWNRMRDRLGLESASLVIFFVGVGCVLAAMLTGLVYTAASMTDWQAVQMWRIEWLLAAISAFLASILLRRAGI